MNIVTIIMATMAGISSLLYAIFWQTPTAQALALLVCGSLLTAMIGWYFRPEHIEQHRKRHS